MNEAQKGRVVGEFIIPRKQTEPVRAVHSTEVQQIAQNLGTVSMMRASHVEPFDALLQAAKDWLYYNNCQRQPLDWFADMLPVNGPVLGPFPTKEAALASEVAYLREHNIPVCTKCRETPTEISNP